MGRWTQYDEDSYRLPAGFTWTGYDADEQKYYYSDRNGTTWASEDRYGVMRPVSTRQQTAPPAPPSRTEQKTSSSYSSNLPKEKKDKPRSAGKTISGPHNHRHERSPRDVAANADPRRTKSMKESRNKPLPSIPKESNDASDHDEPLATHWLARHTRAATMPSTSKKRHQQSRVQNDPDDHHNDHT